MSENQILPLITQETKLKELAQLIDQYISEIGLTEDEKNKKTALLLSVVNQILNN